MPSISELRSRLAKAQAKTTVSRLSSSQCIDILLKVCQKRNITLVPTLNGEELLTLKQLELEVVTAIESRGGRVAVSQLSSSLGIQQNYVECTVEKLLKEHPDQYTRLQDTLITKGYTVWLMEIASRRLQECGVLDICDFASEFELPFDLLKMLISQSHLIDGRMNGNLLESRGYEACKERCVMAALAATTVPTSTLHLATVTRLDVNLVKDTITRLVKIGKVSGELKSGVYTPKVFADHRHASLTTFYSANGYIEKSKVTDVLKSAKDLPAKLFPDAIVLETVYLNRKSLEPISVLVNEAVANGSWRDVGIMLPSDLTSADVAALMDNIKGANKNGYIVCGLYVSTVFEESLVKYVVEVLKERLGPQPLLDMASKDLSKLQDDVSSLLEGDADPIFTECWSIASSEFYLRLEPSLISAIRKSCVMDRPSSSKGVLDVNAATEQLKDHHMKFDSTLKVMEKLCGDQVDNTHLIMKTVAKELLPVDCHMLLQLYSSKNLIIIPGDDGVVGPNNRAAVVESITDKEVQEYFRNYLDAIKQKDVLKGIEASRSLKAAMYITCVAKKERKRFLAAQSTYYEQQLAGLNCDDAIKAAHCTLTLGLLRKGHYAFLVDKDWCLRGCIDSLAELVGDDALLKAVRRCLESPGKRNFNIAMYIYISRA
ncbi:E3 UFM1-protein ligase 1 -like protein [Babesia sp. Xinjiang]|uniref:E3 UFM1-protein ligase 1 -like protein n=1 Tax=Babesia sp. Xinjiang TaxID=462227 RepID=UPI000A217CF5|nr:E3 UFM1-protein ligase 1 -like protein [Babesia sp. Xinjiang]ORM41119.1 E3 UFM1-protein ligase 1 -like protein [Babesia sp. Xinjiang]